MGGEAATAHRYVMVRSLSNATKHEKSAEVPRRMSEPRSEPHSVMSGHPGRQSCRRPTDVGDCYDIAISDASTSLQGSHGDA
jgi:hypothetical protein